MTVLLNADTFPAASFARTWYATVALSGCVSRYVVTAPTLVRSCPLAKMSYPVTPVSSVDGDQPTLTLVALADDTCSAAGIDGGVVSEGAEVELSTIVTRATMPVPSPVSVVSHFCRPLVV